MGWIWIKYWTMIKYWIIAILVFPFLLFINLIIAFVDTIMDCLEAKESCVWNEWIDKTKGLSQEEIEKIFGKV